MSDVPGIDLPAVTRFLRDTVPEIGDAPIRFELISGGKSNLTYRIQAGDRSWALRRPPLGHVVATAHDMVREHRVLAALADTDVPSPRPVALCGDPSVNDAPFYVMEFCDGVVLHGDAPEGYLSGSEDGRRISQALVDTLAALHAVDPASVGLADFGRPQGYLERQVKRWAKQWAANCTDPLPIVDALLERLGAALPEESGHAIVHGDYRLGNMALDPHDPGRIVALFDWEMATLGDPLADLGYTLIYWLEAGEDTESAQMGVGRVTTDPGFFTRDEIVSAYAKASGRDVSAIAFYQVLALTKLAVIAEGIFKRFQLGKTVGQGFDQRATEWIARRALAIAETSDDPRLRG